MKKAVVVTLIFTMLAGLGYSVYITVTKVASDKVIKTVSTELVRSGEMKEIEKSIQSDQELKDIVENKKTTNGKQLPIKTKEQATKVLITKVGISKLSDIKKQVTNGSMSKQEAIQEIEGKLTPEEILSLKVIAYKELHRQN